MSGVGFSELIILALIGLIVLGPERLPKVARQIGGWLGQARRMTRVMRRQLEEELDLENTPEHYKSKQSDADNSISDVDSALPPEPLPEAEASVPANEDDDAYSPAHDKDDIGTGVADAETIESAEQDASDVESVDDKSEKTSSA